MNFELTNMYIKSISPRNIPGSLKIRVRCRCDNNRKLSEIGIKDGKTVERGCAIDNKENMTLLSRKTGMMPPHPVEQLQKSIAELKREKERILQVKIELKNKIDNLRTKVDGVVDDTLNSHKFLFTYRSPLQKGGKIGDNTCVMFDSAYLDIRRQLLENKSDVFVVENDDENVISDQMIRNEVDRTISISNGLFYNSYVHIECILLSNESINKCLRYHLNGK